jgi:hypothetical protein
VIVEEDGERTCETVQGVRSISANTLKRVNASHINMTKRRPRLYSYPRQTWGHTAVLSENAIFYLNVYPLSGMVAHRLYTCKHIDTLMTDESIRKHVARRISSESSIRRGAPTDIIQPEKQVLLSIVRDAHTCTDIDKRM